MKTRPVAALNELESLLATIEDDAIERLHVAERVRAILDLLPVEPWWIGLDRARRLLGVESEATVAGWARLGLLETRSVPEGGIEVLLKDVLQQRLARDALLGAGGVELDSEDLELLRDERPGKAPWERTVPARARAGR